jgi:hypothetical protein
MVTGTAISGNTAGGVGGGVAIASGLASFTGSTISGNSADRGGGIFTGGFTTVRHSTVAMNSFAGVGNGIFVNSERLVLDHSIVALNSGTNGDINGRLGTTIVAWYSLIGNNQGSGLAAAPVGAPDSSGNLIGTPIAPINPLLGPLDENGGRTLTHALLPHSPAIDAGNPLYSANLRRVPTCDQRGEPFRRIHGGRIDIGAFEWQPELTSKLASWSKRLGVRRSERLK